MLFGNVICHGGCAVCRDVLRELLNILIGCVQADDVICLVLACSHASFSHRGFWGCGSTSYGVVGNKLRSSINSHMEMGKIASYS